MTLPDLSKMSTEDRNAFLEGMRKEGYSEDEIVKLFSTGKGFDTSGGAPQAVWRGAQTGAANVAGSPVDLLTSFLNSPLRQVQNFPYSMFFQKDVPQIQDPLGGSESIKRGVNKLFPKATYQNLTDLPPEERPFAAAGEPIGGAMTLLPGIKAFSPTSAMGRSFASSPGLFAGIEGASAVGSGVGSGIAESIDPGDPLTRFTAEVAGGAVSPLSATLRGGRLASGAIKSGLGKATSMISPAGRQTAAASYLQKILTDAGEDPVAVAAKLRAPSLLKPKATAGLLSDSPTMVAIEGRLAKDSAKFAGERDQAVIDSLGNLREAAVGLRNTGDPNDLIAAAKLRNQYFQDLLNARFRQADIESSKAQSGIVDFGRVDAGAASQRAYQVIDESLADARKIERELWAKVPTKQPVVAEETKRAYQAIIKGLAPGQSPELSSSAMNVETFMQSRKLTAGDLQSFRSNMLDEARKSRRSGEWGRARKLTMMADAALVDLQKIPGDEALNARTFSRQLNDAFSRTFSGKALAVDAEGAERISPELMLEKAFGPGGQTAKVQMGGLQQAAEFQGRGVQMQSEQETFLRSMAAQAVDPNTGKVNANRLSAFLAKNEPILERFPALRKELQTAEGAERELARITEGNARANAAIQQRAMFAKISGAEDPQKVIKEVLSGKTPEQDYLQIAKLAKRGGPGAVAGLKASTIDYALARSVGSDGTISMSKFRDALTKPMRPGGLNLVNTMKLYGIMDSGESARLQQILNEGSRIEKAIVTKKAIDEIQDQPSAVFDLILRIRGAELGSAILGPSAGGGQSLIAAGAGSRFARQLFERVPTARINDIIIAAAKDPGYMATLLEKNVGVTQTLGWKKRLAKIVQDVIPQDRQLNAFLIQAGIQPDRE